MTYDEDLTETTAPFPSPSPSPSVAPEQCAPPPTYDPSPLPLVHTSSAPEMEDESFLPITKRPTSPGMSIYDDGLPNPAPTPCPTRNSNLNEQYHVGWQPAPAPEPAPGLKLPSGPSSYFKENIDSEIIENSDFPTFQPTMAPAVDPHPAVCHELITGETIVFSPRTALFTNHCLRFSPSDQHHVIEIKAQLAPTQNPNNLEMVVSTEPLTDVIDPDTRSMRSCAEICDILKSTECDCDCARDDIQAGHYLFIAAEDSHRGLPKEKFFSILTDNRVIDNLQFTQHDVFPNRLMSPQHGLTRDNDFMEDNELEMMAHVGQTGLIVGIIAGIVTGILRKCKTLLEGRPKRRKMSDRIVVPM